MTATQCSNISVRRFAKLSALSLFICLSSPLITTPTVSASSSKTSSKSELSPGKLRSLGEEALLQRNYDEAASYYSKACKLEPHNALNYFKLSRVHHRMKRLDDALENLNKAVELDPTKNIYLKERAKILISLGQCDLAADDYRNMENVDEVAQKNANECASFIRDATDAFLNQRWEEAIYHFNEAISYTDQAIDLLFMKAESSYKSGDYYTSVADTGRILKLQSSHLEAYQLRGESYFRLGEHDMAVTHYREALKQDPEHKGCKAGHKKVKSIMKKDKKGDTALSEGKHKEAIQFWWQAIAIDEEHRPFVRQTLKKIVSSHSHLGEHDTAISEAEKLIRISEDAVSKAFLVLGDAQLEGEKYEEALRSYRQAMDEANSPEEKSEAEKNFQKGETALKQSKTKNYYKILGISRTAKLKEIKKAYRGLAMEWHPDKHTGDDNKEKAEEMFRDISEAYEVLSDVEKRGKYDRGEDVFENQNGGRGHDPHQFFQQHFQFNHGGGGGGGGRQHSFHFG